MTAIHATNQPWLGTGRAAFSMWREDEAEVEPGSVVLMTNLGDREFDGPAMGCSVGAGVLTGGFIAIFSPRWGVSTSIAANPLLSLKI